MEKKLLRPVELYFLLCFIKQEKWSVPDAITAVLVELYERGFIVPCGESEIAVMLIGSSSTKDLRSYELEALRAIKQDSSTLLYDAIDDFRFKQFLLKQGLLAKTNFHMAFGFGRKIISPLGGELIADLLEARNSALTEIPSSLSEITPFPSLAGKNALINYFNKYAHLAALAAVKRYNSYIPELSPMHAVIL